MGTIKSPLVKHATIEQKREAVRKAADRLRVAVPHATLSDLARSAVRHLPVNASIEVMRIFISQEMSPREYEQSGFELDRTSSKIRVRFIKRSVA